MIFVSIASYYAQQMSRKYSSDDEEAKWNPFVFLTFLSLTLVSGLRSNVGTDFWAYGYFYDFVAPTAEISKYLFDEVNYLILCKLLRLITVDSQIMFFVTAAIFNYIVVDVLWKNARKNFTLAIYLFITTYTYYTSFNVLRQCVAVAIIFYNTKYLFNGNYKRLILAVIFAATFHASAVIMILIFLLLKLKDKIYYWIFTIFTVGGFVFYSKTFAIVFSLIENTKYSKYSFVVNELNDGANIMWFLVSFVPLLFMWLNKEKLIGINKSNQLLIRLYEIGTLFMLMALRHNYFARLGLYFNVYSLLLLPQLIYIGNKKSIVSIRVYIIIFYLVYSTVLLKTNIGWVLPYYTKFF